MKTINLTVALILLSLFCYSQVQTPKILPPSPTAAGLGKYGEIPVSLYTGVPNINIPLWQVKNKSLSLPISLSYHASGVKVEEIASWVGLGWALNAGGVITRSVRGLPDEYPSGYLNNGPIIPANKIDLFEDQPYLESIVDGAIDTQPDIYYYNFAGRTGKFLFEEDGTIFTIPYAPLRITKLSAQQFEIIDESGTKYVFGKSLANEEAYEENQPSGGNFNGSSSYISSWYLTDIVSSNTIDHIELKYTSFSGGLSQVVTTETDYLAISTRGECTPPAYSSVISATLATKVQKLSEIISPFGNIQFLSDGNRDDMALINQEHKLNEIVIYRPDGIELKRFSLTYSYFNNNDTDYRKKRLKLLSVKEKGYPQNEVLENQFEYYETPSLPSRESEEQDHWGYYNGSGNSNTLIPAMTVLGSLYPGADREPNENNTKAGSLKKITYPTGGFSSFEHELNTYKLPPNEVVNYTIDYEERVDARGSSCSNTNNGCLAGFCQGVDTYAACTTDIEDIKTFTFNQASATTAIVQIHFVSQDIIDDYLYNSYIQIDKCNPYFEILDITTSVVELSPTLITPSINNNETYREVTLTLQPGHTYQITAKAYCHTDFRTIVKVSWEEPTDEIITHSGFAGGLRVKKITTDDGTSTNPIVKAYNYNDNNGVSNGGLTRPLPIYFKPVVIYRSENIEFSPIPCDLPIECRYLQLTSSSRYSLGATQGGTVGYSTVTELYGNNGENGKSEYHFSFVQDLDAYSSLDWNRGQLVKQVDYSSSGLKKREVINSYNYNNSANLDRTITTLNVEKLKDLSQGGTYCVGSVDYYSGQNWNIWESSEYARWIVIDSSIERLFDPSGVISSEVVNQYEYGNYLHAQLTKTVTTNSDGTQYIKEFLYPLDYSLSLYGSIRPVIETFYSDLDDCLNGTNGFSECLNSRTTNCYALRDACISSYFSCTSDWYDCLEPDIYIKIALSGNTFIPINTNNCDALFPCATNYDNCMASYPSCLTSYPCYSNYESCFNTAITNRDANLSNYATNLDADIAGATSSKDRAILTMQKLHILAGTVEELNWQIKGGAKTLLSGTKTDFQVLANGSVVPHKVQLAEFVDPVLEATFLTNPASYYNTRFEYDEFDDDSNIKQFRKSDDVPHAFIWGYYNKIPAAQVVNGTSSEIAFSSFESDNQGNWSYTPSLENTNISKTGSRSFPISNGITKSDVAPGTYTLSYWTDGSVTPTGLNLTATQNSTVIETVGGWTYEEWRIVVSSTTSLNLGGSGNIDEIRFHPVNAQMTTYCYDDALRVHTVTDPNNVSIKYEYDDFGRLELIKDQYGNIRERYQYNYKN